MLNRCKVLQFLSLIYRVSIKSFPDYKHLLQENYVEYKHIFFSKCNSTQEVLFYNTLVHFNMCSFCIPRRFLVINVCNEGKKLCSPCRIEFWTCESTKYVSRCIWLWRYSPGVGSGPARLPVQDSQLVVHRLCGRRYRRRLRLLLLLGRQIS